MMNQNVGMLFLVGALAIGSARADQTLYEINFEKSEVNTIPDDFLVLNGSFGVAQEKGNKYLRLPGAPLESFGVLFGPTEKEGVSVSARIQGTSRGRRMPAFAVGLNGVAGYRLQISAAKKQIELYKGDDAIQSAAYDWESGQWLRLKLSIQKTAEASWVIAGKVWSESEKEPDKASIEFKETEAPFAGRASVWGSPYSGTPILFDDIVVKKLK